MTLNDARQRRIAYLLNVKAYLRELSILSGRVVTEKNLLPLESLPELRQRSAGLASERTTKFQIPFSVRETPEFRGYIEQLHAVHPSPVYVWTHLTNECGPYLLDSIKSLNLSFPFDIYPEGIFTLLASDFKDHILFDFSEDDAGHQVLEIETEGEHWPSVQFDLAPKIGPLEQ